MSTLTKRILVAGGGTGGHVFPIVNIVRHIQKKNKSEVKIYWAGLAKSLEEKEAQKLPDVGFIAIQSGKLRREKSVLAILRNIVDVAGLCVGIMHAVILLLRNRIDVIFSKGGYVAMPVVLASFITRTKLIIHESDTKFGLANRIAARRAHKIYTAFNFSGYNVEVVGQLLSDDIAKDYRRDALQSMLSVPTAKDVTHVLVMGGSQGARSLYSTLADIIREGKEFNDMHFIVISGLLNKENNLFEGLSNVTVLDFVEQQNMAILLKFCDVGVVRAGTTSLAEQKMWDMRLIMVPLPRTHDQQTNAEYYMREYSDELVVQDDHIKLHLANTLREYLGYHKDLKDTNRKKMIADPKEIVVQNLLSSN